MKYKYDESALPDIICDEHPGWVEMYRDVWRMAFKNIRYPANKNWKPYLGCLSNTPTAWVTDSCFMVFFMRYSNGVLPGMNNLDNFYRLQREDGYISMAYDPDPERESFPGRIMTPIFAWAEWEYYRFTGDSSRFKKVLPVLVKYFDWIKANRRRPNGLYWFEDSGSAGLDNSPRGGYPSLHQDGSDICFVDLACQQALSAFYIKKIAGFLGDEKTAGRFETEHRELVKLINEKHWGERYGFYYDLNYKPAGGEFRNYYINHKTTAAFWSMLCGAADFDRVKRLVEHILDPHEFWTGNPVPALSKDDPNYDPLGNYHCGGVWVYINYMIASGLRACGRHDAAKELSLKHLLALERVWNGSSWGKDMWEAYSADYDRPATHSGGTIVRARNVGFSGLAPLSMLPEFIMGFDFDSGQNRIKWIISELGRHGISNLRFNGQKVSLIAEKMDREKTGRVVRVENEKELVLDISNEGFVVPMSKRLHNLTPGYHEFFIP
ncbi:MAG TPA: trehalase family glycosidase [bacterium]|nr:trehalase family glycosidase [bacterium]